MKKIYFCISDIHSGYTFMKKALDEAGFDVNNEDHILISLGDNFDRLDESVEVYNFLSSLPKNRRVLVRGNHEDLLMELLKKDRPDSYDYSNGTVKTICNFTGTNEIDVQFGTKFISEDLGISAFEVWTRAVKKFKKLPIYNFVKDKENWVDYYEIGDYILVHSFLPLEIKAEYEFLKFWPHSYLESHMLQEKLDWREKSLDYEWRDARWGCPWELFKRGLLNEEIKKGKTLICGHWHTSDFFTEIDGEEMSIDECPIYNRHGIIALDACTVHTKRCNVFKIEEKAYGK